MLGNLSVLGSTGSVGTQTLDVVRESRGKYRVLALTARSNVELLCRQIEEFSPEIVALSEPQAADELCRRVGGKVRVLSGEEGVIAAATYSKTHTVVASLVGFAGLQSVLAAIDAGKHVALANKESLVAGGPLVKRALEASESVLVPLDSEHTALFQCFSDAAKPLMGKGHKIDSLRRVIITASGGPFAKRDASTLHLVTPEEALKHPRWDMGPKISLDSATLMNKGLEVIEAAWLFDFTPEQIDVLIHPQSLVHAMVEFSDGSLLASIYDTDMKIPIAYGLDYLWSESPATEPGRRSDRSFGSFLDLAKQSPLEFSEVDEDKFPSLGLCYDALRTGGTACTVLNAANEIAGESFLANKISFTDIPLIVKQCLEQLETQAISEFSDIITADSKARELASYLVDQSSQTLKQQHS